MHIIRNRRTPNVPIGDIVPGQIFELEDLLYMRLQHKGFGSTDRFNAVDLRDGCLCLFNPTTPIIPIPGDFVERQNW